MSIPSPVGDSCHHPQPHWCLSSPSPAPWGTLISTLSPVGVSCQHSHPHWGLSSAHPSPLGSLNSIPSPMGVSHQHPQPPGGSLSPSPAPVPSLPGAADPPQVSPASPCAEQGVETLQSHPLQQRLLCLTHSLSYPASPWLGEGRRRGGKGDDPTGCGVSLWPSTDSWVQNN